MISSCPSGRAFAPKCGPPPLPTPPSGDVGGGVPSLDLPPAPEAQGDGAPASDAAPPAAGADAAPKAPAARARRRVALDCRVSRGRASRFSA